MLIRRPLTSETAAIRGIYVAAFDEQERQQVAELVEALLNCRSTPETFHLVAEDDGQLVGHVAFSPVKARLSGELLGYILAPLAVIPSAQRQGVGSALVQHGLQQLSEQQITLAFVYGDPRYYGRFGFHSKAAAPYLPPFALGYPEGWLTKVLIAGNGHKAPIEIACVEPLHRPDLW